MKTIQNTNVIYSFKPNMTPVEIVEPGDTLDDAIKAAADQAVEHLAKGLDISWEKAYMLASLIVDIRISQVVDPKKTARAVIPKMILNTDKLIRSI